MDDVVDKLNDLFGGSSSTGISKDVITEMQSILRLHSISPQELFYKWESYCLKMGAEETVMNLETVRSLKRDIQEALERDSRGKNHLQSVERRRVITATPRGIANNQDVFGL
jgi:DNA polymerase alpha subunit B